MSQAEPLVYLNGQTLPASQATLAIYDAGIVLGATVTEQTRTFRHQPFRLHDHLNRLFRSLRYTRMEIGLTKDELAQRALELINHNVQLLDKDGELGLIQFVTAGEYAAYATGGPARTAPTVCMHTFALPFERWSKPLREGARLVTPSIRHVPPQCYDPKMKYRSRMHFYLADLEAKQADAEASALLLDLDGNITETSAANFLIAKGGTLISPTTRNTLPGISRAVTMELAARLGIPFVERDFQVFDAINADEALLTSTPYGVMPVTRLNGVRISAGRPGPIFRRLMDAWNQEAGVDIEQQIHDGARRRAAVKNV